MKPSLFLAGALAVIAIAGCSSKPGDAATGKPAKHVTVAPPKGGDWTQIVSASDGGGFVMGNPKARVKLVEYGSMTCPHCRAFDELAVPQLLAKYVKTGEVSWEFRNYVRDPFDITAALVARCNGAKTFFPITRALYTDQSVWIDRVQAAPKEQLEKLQDLPPAQQFAAVAKLAGFPQYATKVGVPAAKVDQCLADEGATNQLVQMASDAASAYPDFKGTPAFVVDGAMVDLGPVKEDEVWPALEKKLQEKM
jgi:protein-disulfide isomerase